MSCDHDGDGLAPVVVAALQRLGVRDWCLAGGARNSALVAAVVDAAGGGGGDRWHAFIDERAAGFFALGRSMGTGRPVAVVTTSGTAAAELLPALIEAFYAGRRVIAVTADRPARFSGSGAPQAIEQADLFGGFVRERLDLGPGAREPSVLASWRPAGWPVHLNVRFEDPVRRGAAAVVSGRDGEGKPAPVRAASGGFPAKGSESSAEDQWVEAARAGRGLGVVVGELEEDEIGEVADFLRRLGAPVLAEATSGLRELEVGGQDGASPGMALCRGGDPVFAGLPLGRILRIGGVPSGSSWRDLEARADVAVASITRRGFSGLARPSVVLDSIRAFEERLGAAEAASGADPGSSALLELMDRADRERAGSVESALCRFPRSEPAWVRRLSEVVPAGSRVFLGNSLPIREWNAFATFENRGLRCRANRGANGIDGLVATFLGWSQDTPESWAVLGDLSAFYDSNALAVTPQLAAARRRIVVINNGGGRIFSRLPALRERGAAFLECLEHRHAFGFRAWAEQWGWSHVRITREAELDAALSDGLPGHVVLEVVPAEAETEGFWAAIAAGTEERS